MSRVLFRCDASLSIGSGHVMRCRTLAHQLQSAGAEITFLCRQQPGDLIELLEREFVVLALPEQPLAACEGLVGRDLYRAWLGCSQEHDAFQCLEALAEACIGGFRWLVVDHYGLDASWEEQVCAGLLDCNQMRILVIDDLADRVHKADLLLDQNFFGKGTDQRYQGLVPRNCRQLLGPHYALLGPEYPLLHQLVPARTELRRILLYFGGVDSKNLTGLALEALDVSELSHLAVDVVIGCQSVNKNVVSEMVNQRPNTTLYTLLPSLAGLVARADLAIGAVGATTWERACLSLPSLVVTIAANQLPLAQALHQSGYVDNIGDSELVTTQMIRSALLALVSETNQAKPVFDLTDGWGAKRLELAMLGDQGLISLSSAKAADEALLLRWANDLQVRNNSFSPEPILPSSHAIWFKKALLDPNRLLFIAKTVDGCPIGQIRFDRLPDVDKPLASVANVDVSLDLCARGQGMASELLRLGLQAMEQCWGQTTDVVAEVLKSNVASNACFSRTGFQLEANSANSQTPVVNRWRFRRG